jgi:hypothetical protein
VTAAVRERLPQPMTVDGIVYNDVMTRTLEVSRPQNLSGYQKLSWRTAHEALVRAEQYGWRSPAAPFLWANGVGQTDIAHGLPGDNLKLLFHFPIGKDAYRQLVSQPGLAAFVSIDKSTGWFMSVRFRHSRRD